MNYDLRDVEVIARLNALYNEHRSWAAVARAVGVNKGLVRQVMSGRVHYSERLRKALGLAARLPNWRPEPDAVPLSRILGGHPRQCPECVEEWRDGRRGEIDTWYYYASPSRVYCCREHGRAHRRRMKVRKGDGA